LCILFDYDPNLLLPEDQQYLKSGEDVEQYENVYRSMLVELEKTAELDFV